MVNENNCPGGETVEQRWLLKKDCADTKKYWARFQYYLHISNSIFQRAMLTPQDFLLHLAMISDEHFQFFQKIMVFCEKIGKFFVLLLPKSRELFNLYEKT